MGSIIRWFLVLVLLLPARLWAVEVIDGPRVVVEGTTATVWWKLDTPAGGTVRFGLAEGALSRSEKSAVVATEHTVKLDGLQPGVRYHYSIGTARRPLRAGSFVAGAGPATGGERVPGRGDGPSRRGGPADGAPSPAKDVPAAADPAAPPARRTWANVATLQDHFERHGRDFAATSAEDYAAQAWRFLQRAKTEGLPAKIDPEGTLRVWDPRSRSFAAYTRQGMTKTYFKPGSRDYFERQPGRPVRLQPDGGPGGG